MKGELRFEWDGRKALVNKRKHGVPFEEAETVFSDDFALVIGDPDHSGEEERFLILGLSSRLRTLVVSQGYLKGGNVIRIISARKATRKERKTYNRRWHR